MEKVKAVGIVMIVISKGKGTQQGKAYIVSDRCVLVLLVEVKCILSIRH